jgi:hypothetical protein
MAATRWTLFTLTLASALLAQPAVGQGASVSLTHTVTVTVPPRVKVQLANASVDRGVSIAPTAGRAVNISVSATQSWALSIASRGGNSSLQWASGNGGGFTPIGQGAATIATGKISQVPVASTLFLRTAERAGGSDDSSEGEAVVLTMVAP